MNFMQQSQHAREGKKDYQSQAEIFSIGLVSLFSKYFYTIWALAIVLLKTGLILKIEII